MRLRSVLVLPFAAALVFAACSNQGEGEICDRDASNGGNDDCQSGLVCGPSPNPNIHGFRCCPPAGTAATTVECSQPIQPIEAGTAAPDAASDAPAVAPPAADGGDDGGASADAASPADGAAIDAPAADAGAD
jgi:hypothetical protein